MFVIRERLYAHPVDPQYMTDVCDTYIKMDLQ